MTRFQPEGPNTLSSRTSIGQLEGQQYLRSLDPAHFPSIAQVAPEIGARSPAEAFEIGPDVVIEGIAARLIPPGRVPAVTSG